MAGISIPIGGDLSPIEGSLKELVNSIRQLTSTINAAFEPAAQAAKKATANTHQAAGAAKQARGSFMDMATAISSVGANVVHMATGLIQMRRIKSMTTGLVSGFRMLTKSPAFRKIAVGAVGAVAAIGGMVVAFKAVRGVLRGLTAIGRRVFSGLMSGARRAANAIKGIFTGGGAVGGALRLAGVAGVLALATTQLKGAFGAATGFEDLQVRMEQFTGSAEEAKKLIDELTNFSTQTPFETKDILSAAAKLQSAGIAGDIAAITKELGGVSKDGQQLGELADALAKGFAKGKFQTEELNKFLERGINLMPELERVTGKSGDALKKAIESGLGFDTVTEAIRRMSAEGGQFFGLLERQSRTTTGLISTLKSVWDEVRRSFAQPILDGIKPVLMGGIDLLNQLREKAAAVGASVRDIFLGAFVLIRDGRVMELLGVGFRLAITGGLDVLMRGLRSAVAFLVTALPPVIEAAFSKISDPTFWAGLNAFLFGVGKELAASIKESLPFADMAEVDMMRREGRMFRDAGVKHMGAAGGADFGKVLEQSLIKGIEAAAKAGGGAASESFQAAQDAWKALLGSVGDQVAAIRDKVKVPEVAPGASGPGPGARLSGDASAGGLSRAITIASDLARVGGGGFGIQITPIVSEQRKTNRLLTRIEGKMTPSSEGLVFA